MRPTSLATLAVLVALATPSLAADKPLRIAVEMHAARSFKGATETATSMTRRVAANLTPLIEAQGFEVVRVEDVSEAAKSGRYHLAVRVSVDARPVHHVRSARVFDEDEVNHLDVDFSRSVSAWGRWEAWDGMTGRRLDGWRIDPITAQLQTAGAGVPELDDEESVARVFAQTAHDALSLAISPSRALAP